MADALVLAYLAGIIDGDGYITIQRSKHKGRLYFGPKLGIAGTRREPHDLAASIWGGKISLHDDGRHRPVFQWSRCGEVAVEAIRAITPFLRVKVQQAGLAVELWDHVLAGRGADPYPWFVPEYDATPQSDELLERMIELNQSRNRVGKKAAGRLLDGREWSEYPQ